MSAINVLTIQGYYYLYALFIDYPLNNEFHIDREERERIRDLLRRAQPLLELKQPFRLDWRLRLFTKRQSLERFSSERVHELLRQLHNTVALLSPPSTHPLRRASDPGVARRKNGEAHRHAAPEPHPISPPVFPRSPVDYRLTA